MNFAGFIFVNAMYKRNFTEFGMKEEGLLRVLHIQLLKYCVALELF